MSGIIKKLSRLNGIIRKDCGKLSLRKTDLPHDLQIAFEKKNRQPETKYQLDLVDLRFWQSEDRNTTYEKNKRPRG